MPASIPSPPDFDLCFLPILLYVRSLLLLHTPYTSRAVGWSIYLYNTAAQLMIPSPLSYSICAGEQFLNWYPHDLDGKAVAWAAKECLSWQFAMDAAGECQLALVLV